MNLAYKKILGKFTKVLGFGKFPNNIVFFFWQRTLLFLLVYFYPAAPASGAACVTFLRSVLSKTLGSGEAYIKILKILKILKLLSIKISGEWGGRHVEILKYAVSGDCYKMTSTHKRISQNLATLQHSASLERSGWSSGLGGTSWRSQSRSRMLREWSHLARATPASAPNWRTASPPRPSLSTAGSGRRAVNWKKSHSQWKLSPGSTIW